MVGVTWWLTSWGSLRAAYKPKTCFFLVSEDPDQLTNLGSENSWERQVPVRLIKQQQQKKKHVKANPWPQLGFELLSGSKSLHSLLKYANCSL